MTTPGPTLSFSGPAAIPLRIPFVYQGQDRSELGQLLRQSDRPNEPTLSYGFTGYPGIWQIDSLAGNDTEGFLSFSYLPCPSG